MKQTNIAVEHDRRLERRFSRTIKAILGNQFIVQDPAEDMKGGSDFVVWTLTNIRVAARLRTYGYFLSFPDQFTLRWSRPSGVDTEIHKIKKGLVDYLIYGFVNEDETQLVAYFIGDLQVFRFVNPRPVAIHENKPPDSKLAVYNLSQFPGDFLIKKWVAEEKRL